MVTHPRPLLRFDGFTLDLDNERLLNAGAAVPLTPKAFALLAHLASRPDQLVRKDEMLDAVWGRRFVSEGTIKSLLAELRVALGDDARAPRWVQTVQRRGLRFIGRLQPAADVAPVASLAPLVPPALPLGETAPIARGAEQQALAEALDRHRLVTLCGPAGVGKTCLALALAAARAPAAQVWWIELAPLAPADADAAALRAVLCAGLRLAGTAAVADAALAAASQPLQGLLVLDNAEHVVPALAPLVALLLRHAPRLALLVTSREPLKLSAEHLLRLAPLAPPLPADDTDPARVRASAAVQLFSARVAGQLHGFALTDAQCAAAARACRALDGLPLALEMGAARVPVLGVGGLADHLEGLGHGTEPGGARLALLTQGPRDRAPHQRTLRESIAWSHALLTPLQRRVLRRLAVFRGSFSLQAASSVCADAALAGAPAAELLDAVQGLLEKSLVGSAASAPPGGPRRFMLLESVREFAQEQLHEAGEFAAASRAQAFTMERQFRQADDVALDVAAMPWLDEQLLDLDNLRAALRCAREGAEAGEAAQAITLISLVGSAHLLWLRHALATEARAWCDAAAACAAALPAAEGEEARARADLTRAGLAFIYRSIPVAEGHAAALRAIPVFERLGDARRQFHAHAMAASTLCELGRADEADRMHLPAMRALAQPGWSRLRLRFLRSAEGMAARRRGDLATFRALAREEWRVSREHGARGEAWTASYTLALAEALHGAPEAALQATSAVLSEILAAGRQQQFGQLISLHALLAARHRAPAQARDALAISTPLIPLMGACEIQWLALAWLAWQERRAEAAAGVLGWFESPSHGAASRYGAGTLIGSLHAELRAGLDERLGAAAAGRARQQGEDWGAERALAAGLARPERPERVERPAGER